MGVTLINLKSPVVIDNFPVDIVRFYKVCILLALIWRFGRMGWRNSSSGIGGPSPATTL